MIEQRLPFRLMLQHLRPIPMTGYGQLLWTAFGDPDCRQRVIANITAEALRRDIDGPAVTPTMVMQSVDALAAFDPTMLASLAAQWVAPEQISSDLYDSAADFWASAWTAALRHLRRIGAISRPTGAIPNYQLNSEVEVVFAPEDRTPISWRGLIAELNGQNWDYRSIRKQDNRMAIQGTIDGELLCETLKSPGDYSGSKRRWRIFRHRTDRFDESARHLVAESLRDAWQQQNTQEKLHGEVVTLLELAKELQIANMDEFAADIPPMLNDSISVEDILTISFVVVSKHWFTP